MAKRLVHVALPASVVEELLRRHELHIEQLQCLDEHSQRMLHTSLKHVLLLNRRQKPA